MDASAVVVTNTTGTKVCQGIFLDGVPSSETPRLVWLVILARMGVQIITHRRLISNTSRAIGCTALCLIIRGCGYKQMSKASFGVRAPEVTTSDVGQMRRAMGFLASFDVTGVIDT